MHIIESPCMGLPLEESMWLRNRITVDEPSEKFATYWSYTDLCYRLLAVLSTNMYARMYICIYLCMHACILWLLLLLATFGKLYR